MEKPNAIVFDCPLSFDGLINRLNQVGPWTWRAPTETVT
jgi:hypothetical protein